ncbi:BatD family protein [Phaeobacter sp. 22II1-1F12B]|uniref:BatD family protein n=1 Tax=Phaeobacter sp. 22II1-1F12B TaxID=1317111 RepID=UPI0013038352|nr:BatD family protein [Phaeobacter sp. 22II1-1F12B]
MRHLLLCLLLLPGVIAAQTRDVNPGELALEVTLETSAEEIFQGEMVLVTIHGRYRRHITLEKLETPELDGFNWMQLGQDTWYETRERGQPIKNFRRRMALFPDRTGALTIPPFVHHLTLTDEGDDWFEHEIASAPVSLDVRPAPAVEGWWFPVRQLEISDQWSNAPDQLQPGEGVLRVIRIQAIGVSPDMIPPMPELHSPSAMIFPHPDKRFVELSPMGPVSIAFWRWTIRPTNNTSAIIEPIEFDYFDTTTRKMQTVTISAQRIAMEESAAPPGSPPPEPARLHPLLMAFVFLVALGTGTWLLWPGRNLALATDRFGPFDPLRFRLRQSARRGDFSGLRHNAAALIAREGTGQHLLREFDEAVFREGGIARDQLEFTREFAARLTRDLRKKRRERARSTAT